MTQYAKILENLAIRANKRILKILPYASIDRIVAMRKKEYSLIEEGNYNNININWDLYADVLREKQRLNAEQKTDYKLV